MIIGQIKRLNKLKEKSGKVTWGTGAGCAGTYQGQSGEFVRLISGGSTACLAEMDLLWKWDGDGIRLTQIHLDGLNAQDYEDIARFLDRIWTKID